MNLSTWLFSTRTNVVTLTLVVCLISATPLLALVGGDGGRNAPDSVLGMKGVDIKGEDDGSLCSGTKIGGKSIITTRHCKPLLNSFQLDILTKRGRVPGAKTQRVRVLDSSMFEGSEELLILQVDEELQGWRSALLDPNPLRPHDQVYVGGFGHFNGDEKIFPFNGDLKLVSAFTEPTVELTELDMKPKFPMGWMGDSGGSAFSSVQEGGNLVGVLRTVGIRQLVIDPVGRRDVLDWIKLHVPDAVISRLQQNSQARLFVK